MIDKVSPSFWEKQTFYRAQQVIIVGSGIVGLTAAYFLKQKDKSLRITIIERGSIPTGASTRNAGFACFGSISELLSDQSQQSIDQVESLIRMRESGLRLLRHIVPDEEMEYHHSGGFEYFPQHQEELYKSCESQIDHFNSVVKEATGLANTFAKVPASRFGFLSHLPLIYNQHEGQLHPAKMIIYLKNHLTSQGVSFLNGARVKDIIESGNEVKVQCHDNLELVSEQLILATNAFSSKIIDVKDVKAVRNQVFLTNEINGLQAIGCFHCEEGYVYFRNVGKRILIGGARQHFDTEETENFGQTQEVKDYLLNFIKTEIGLPNELRFEHEWSGILAVGESKKPIIQRISPRQTIGVRMGGMGIAIGSKVGKKLADLTFS